MFVKASLCLVFLLLASMQVLSESIELVKGSDVIETRKVRQVATALPVGNKNPFLQTVNPTVVPASRLGIVGGLAAGTPFTGTGTILRAPLIGSSLPVTAPANIPSRVGLRTTLGMLGRTRASIASAPASPAIRSVVSNRLAASRPSATRAAVVQPNLSAIQAQRPPIVQLPSQRPVAPVLSVPGILRAGRSVPESNEEEAKKPETIQKIEAHHRVKRQYFKPSIDGSMLSNDRSQLLKASNESKSATTTLATHHEGQPKKPKITVAGLIHSLFQLFDRIKSVLKKALDEHDSE